MPHAGTANKWSGVGDDNLWDPRGWGKDAESCKKSCQVYRLAVALFLLKMQEHLQLLNTEKEKQLNIQV